MAECSYTFADADGKQVTLNGKPAIKAAIADGVLDHLMSSKMIAALGAIGEPTKFSRAGSTIIVDGVARPVTNSKGQPIHPTEEGVRNFWRWFSPSPGQLLDGLSVSEISGLKRDTKALADFIESQSGVSQPDRFTVIPSSVFAHVAGAVNNGKILDAVVRSLPVDVVNFLGGKQGSAKEVLHNASMLEQVFSVDPASDVSLGVNPSSIAELLVRMVANAGAKISGLTSGALERNAAMLADANDPILGGHIRANTKRDLSIIAGFGDSKVVDEQGRPLVVYHGTQSDFSKFDSKFHGKATDSGDFGTGFYFSPNSGVASGYAGAGSVMPSYLAISAPLSVKSMTDVDIPGFWSAKESGDSDRESAAIKNAGYDGVIESDSSVQYVVFSPEQIKSASGNTGAFSSRNADIRYSRGDSSSSIHPEDAEASLRIVRKAYPGVQFSLHDSDASSTVPKDLKSAIRKAGASGDVKGAYHNGEIHLFRSAIPDIKEFEFTAAHESTHFGLSSMLGPELDSVMLHINKSNPAIAERAQALQDKYGYSVARSTEEALADLGGDMVKVNGWKRLVALVRDFLRRHGFVSRWTDNDIVALIQSARDYAKNPNATTVYRGSVFSQGLTAGQNLGKDNGMDDANNVAGKQAPTPAGDVEAGGAKPDFNAAAEQILAAIQNDDSYSDFGLRVIPGEFSGPVAIGDSIPNSFVWNNGDKTDEEIPGVSTAGIDSPTLQSVVRAIKNLGAHGKPGPNGYYFGDRIVLVKGERVSSGEDVGETIISNPEVVGIWRKPDQGNSEIIPNEPSASGGSDVKFSRAGQPSLGELDARQQQAVENVFGKPKTLKERAQEFAKDWKKNLIQGVFDQYAPIKDLSSKGYMLARLAKGGDSSLEAMLMYGKLSVDSDGVYRVDYDGKGMNGFAQAMAKLDGEHDRFLAWVSANRAEQLASVGLENLMTPQDIAALKSLAKGKNAAGKDRGPLYAQALRDLNSFNDSVLKIAVDSGLIDEATRQMYKDMPYVPFYRLSEDDAVKGPVVSKGLVNQSAWKKLKGGTDKLNEDLMGNLLKNWSHLITASANNRASKEVLDTAARMGAATDMTNDVVAQDINGQPIYRGNTTGLVRYRGEIKRKIPAGQPYVENGKTLISDGTAEISYVGDRYFRVDDPHLMDAIASIGFTPKVWKPMADFKRYLTFGVTVNPAFKIRNLIRDSIQAVGTADLSYNPVQNILMGAKATEMLSETRAQMLASGGMLRFGSSEGAHSGHVRRLIEKGVDPQYILDDDSKIKALWKHKILPAFEAYQELGDRSENVNRAALYEQLIAKGMSHAEASFWARDMMDFSMQGKWAAVRTLTAVVPFMNARLQGLYKLGRATAQDYKRMGATLAAVSLASIALMLAYQDDDDWKKREDWDRDGNWWFKIGDTAFRIPKPFEVGAVGTIAERSLELMINDEMTGKRFGQRMRDLVMQNLSMNPTPQIVKPMIDLYANKDSFSGRDIETQGMERMRPEDRYTAQTSEVARFLGSLGLPNPAQLMMGRWEGLSPVQVDHLIRGYFSWLGTTTTNVLDRGIRPMMNRGEEPERRLKDTFLVGNFVESLPSGSSRYVTEFYNQAKEIEQMFASYQQALKEGDAEKAEEIRADNADKFAERGRVAAVKRSLSEVSAQMRKIEQDRNLSGEEKRSRLDDLEKRRDAIVRRSG